MALRAGRWRFYAVGFLLLMAFDTLAQISFKYAGLHALPLEFSAAWLQRVFGQPWIYGAFVGYTGAFFTWMSLLEHAPIGPAFAASHLEIVSVLLLSALLFDERIGWAQAVGALFIVAGIVCLAVGEAQEHEEQAAPPAADGPSPDRHAAVALPASSRHGAG